MSHPSGSVGATRTPSLSNLRSTPLFRGTGCHHCRTRKVKCDAGKPFCVRCVQQGTTDRCKYDEVKKSKLTLVKEENAGLKERIAELERQLAGVSPPGLGKLALEDVKDPPSSTFSQIPLESEEDYEHEQDEEADNAAGGDPINIGSEPYQVQPQQPSSHGTRPEHFQTGPAQLPQVDPYSRTPRAAQSGGFGVTPTPAQYQLPSDQYQPAYQDRHYPQSAGHVFHAGGFNQMDAHAHPATYTPHIQTGSLPNVYGTWPPTPSDAVPPSASTSNFSPLSATTSWRQLPYLSPQTTPKSPGSSHLSTNYPSGAMFSDDGSYFGGPMASFDAYQGAPIEAPVARRRPVPSPPVYGHDVVISFFQRWKAETQSQAYIEDPNVQNPAGGCWDVVGNWWERDDLSVANRNYLLELFLPYRKQVGLEIWVPDFLASLHLPPQRRPHPGFMWMIYTFAAFFSGEPELKELVPEFMQRARRNLDEAYAKGDRLFDYIRGQTLYASVLYMSGHINEGGMATSIACHAAIVCGLHKISSPVVAPRAQHQSREQSAYRIKPIAFQLEPATSPREHGERIAAFWQLILVDHSAAATTGMPAIFRDDGDERSRVETVFPRPLEEYISGEASRAPYATLGDIFTSKAVPNPPDTAVTMQVKVNALLERAVRLSTKWDQGKHISTTNPNKYQEEFNTVLHAIHHFKSYLPGLRPQEGNDAESRLPLTSGGLIYERLFPHFLIWNADIQMYNMLEEEQLVAREECIRSAREIKNLTALLTDDELKQLGVLLGHCWTSAHHVLLRERTRCQEHQDQVGFDLFDRELDVIQHGLDILAANHHLAAVQADRAGRSRNQAFPVGHF